MPAEVGSQDTATSAGREVRDGWSVGSTVEAAAAGEVGGAQLVFCYSARDETRGLGLGEQKGRSHFLFLFTLHFLLQVRSLPG